TTTRFGSEPCSRSSASQACHGRCSRPNRPGTSSTRGSPLRARVPPAAGALREARAGLEAERSRDLDGGRLGAAVAGAGAAKGAVARGDREAIGVDREHGAGRRASGRLDAPRLVEAKGRAAPDGVRAGLRVAAADQVVDLGCGAAPVDPGMLVAAERIVARVRLVLRDARRPALADERDRIQHRAYAE